MVKNGRRLEIAWEKSHNTHQARRRWLMEKDKNLDIAQIKIVKLCDFEIIFLAWNSLV